MFIRGTTKQVKRMERVLARSQTAEFTKAIGNQTKNMDKEL